MSTIITRSGKGFPLSHSDMDNNLINLNADKVENSLLPLYVTKTGVETLSNKTIALATNSVSGTLSDFNTACTDADFSSATALSNSSGSSLVGFIQTIPSAIATTVQTKIRDILSISDGISSLTLNVPSQYGTIQAAFSYLNTKQLAPGFLVTIQVADGTYTISSGISLNHPQGSQISLVGNATTPANCILTTSAAPSFDCLSVSSGNEFGLINGFTITTPSKAGSANNFTGILAVDNSSLIEVKNCTVNNWYYSIAERSDSHIYTHDCIFSNAGDVSVWGFCGGSIRATNLTVSGASDSVNDLGYGFQAEYGATLEITSSSATTCRKAGFAALSNGTGRYYSCTSNSNNGSGFVSQAGGVIEANGSTASTNTRYGIECFGAGTVTGLSTNSGNTLGVDNGMVYFDQGSLGARIAANGDLRIDNNGTGSTHFNTSGGMQFSISHTPSAVNRWVVTGGGTGAGLYLDAVGSDTNVSTNIRAKGSEVVRLISNTKAALQAFSSSSSVVNYLQANASLTGAAVQLVAAGSDSVIDMAILPKGAGSYVQLGAGFTGTGDVACNGYITVKDNVGTIRKLMTTV